VLAADALRAEGWPARSNILVRNTGRWPHDRLPPATATRTGAPPPGVAFPRPERNVNGNEESPHAKRQQVPNKGMQLTRGVWSWCILSCRLGCAGRAREGRAPRS